MRDYTQRTPPPCLPDTLKRLCSEPCPTCRRQEGRNQHGPCLRLAILGDAREMNGLFFTFFPHLWSIKELGIQIPTRRLFWEVVSLPSPWSAGFLNAVIFLASAPRPLGSLACHATSRVSLASVTLPVYRSFSLCPRGPACSSSWELPRQPLQLCQPVLQNQSICISRWASPAAQWYRIHPQGRRHGFDPWVGKISWRRAWQPTQYSCLENPMDRGAWWATVHGVTESWTWLSN